MSFEEKNTALYGLRDYPYSAVRQQYEAMLQKINNQAAAAFGYGAYSSSRRDFHEI